MIRLLMKHFFTSFQHLSLSEVKFYRVLLRRKRNCSHNKRFSPLDNLCFCHQKKKGKRVLEMPIIQSFKKRFSAFLGAREEEKRKSFLFFSFTCKKYFSFFPGKKYSILTENLVQLENERKC
jgi:hypothetical protein